MDQPLKLEYVDPRTLDDNPNNWRVHPQTQMGALSGVLAEVGWAGALLYNQSTKRLLDGHARKKLAISKGVAAVPVLVGNWTLEQEGLILSSLDPIAAMAVADNQALEKLLNSLPAGTRGNDGLQDLFSDLVDSYDLDVELRKLTEQIEQDSEPATSPPAPMPRASLPPLPPVPPLFEPQQGESRPQASEDSSKPEFADSANTDEPADNLTESQEDSSRIPPDHVSTFRPNEEPASKRTSVTDEDVQEAAGRMETKYVERTKLVRALCPSCAEEFFVNPNDAEEVVS